MKSQHKIRGEEGESVMLKRCLLSDSGEKKGTGCREKKTSRRSLPGRRGAAIIGEKIVITPSNKKGEPVPLRALRKLGHVWEKRKKKIGLNVKRKSSKGGGSSSFAPRTHLEKGIYPLPG